MSLCASRDQSLVPLLPPRQPRQLVLERLEEPASGTTTAAALPLYLAANGKLAGSNLVSEQGLEMGRPSRIDITVEAADIATIRGAARKLLAERLTYGVTTSTQRWPLRLRSKSDASANRSS